MEELRGIFQIVLHCLLAAAGTAGAKSYLSVVCIKWPELGAADVLMHEELGVKEAGYQISNYKIISLFLCIG